MSYEKPNKSNGNDRMEKWLKRCSPYDVYPLLHIFLELKISWIRMTAEKKG